jgi:hypothetical protein
MTELPPFVTTPLQRHRWDLCVGIATTCSEVCEVGGHADPMFVAITAPLLYWSDLPIHRVLHPLEELVARVEAFDVFGEEPVVVDVRQGTLREILHPVHLVPERALTLLLRLAQVATREHEVADVRTIRRSAREDLRGKGVVLERVAKLLVDAGRNLADEVLGTLDRGDAVDSDTVDPRRDCVCADLAKRRLGAEVKAPGCPPTLG